MGTHSSVVQKIVSGGQTGVDRGALDAAIEAGIPAGGWCPKGRRAEDGRIPEIYPLQETDSADYQVRTERNVVDSDATLILCRGPLTGGTQETQRMALRHGKPLLVIDLDDPSPAQEVREWLVRHGVKTLNVAGPRESHSPGIRKAAHDYLLRVLLPEAS